MPVRQSARFLIDAVSCVGLLFVQAGICVLPFAQYHDRIDARDNATLEGLEANFDTTEIAFYASLLLAALVHGVSRIKLFCSERGHAKCLSATAVPAMGFAALAVTVLASMEGQQVDGVSNEVMQVSSYGLQVVSNAVEAFLLCGALKSSIRPTKPTQIFRGLAAGITSVSALIAAAATVMIYSAKDGSDMGAELTAKTTMMTAAFAYIVSAIPVISDVYFSSKHCQAGNQRRAIRPSVRSHHQVPRQAEIVEDAVAHEVGEVQGDGPPVARVEYVSDGMSI